LTVTLLAVVDHEFGKIDVVPCPVNVAVAGDVVQTIFCKPDEPVIDIPAAVKSHKWEGAFVMIGAGIAGKTT
jgi:hypothetical protein